MGMIAQQFGRVRCLKCHGEDLEGDGNDVVVCCLPF